MIRAIVALLALFWVSSAVAAGVRGPAELNLYDTPAEARWAPFYADLPPCDDTRVLYDIAARFHQTENEYWGGVYAIGGYDRVRDIGFRADGLSFIPRRYCVARAFVVDPKAPPELKKPHTVVYSIGANVGIIGQPSGVEWCVVGFDRMRAFAPDCYALRPILERWIGEYKHPEYGIRARY